MIRFARLLLLLALIWSFAGCASVPLAAMVQLASFGADDFQKIDPAQVRVRLSVSQGFEVDVAKAALRLSTPSADRASRELAMSLELMERSTMTRSLGFFSGESSVPTYLLRLTPKSAAELTKLKKSLAAKGKGERGFSVSAPFSQAPKNPESVIFWADLRLADDDSWIALIDGAKIKFKKTK